jgi:hypothetical protein
MIQFRSEDVRAAFHLLPLDIQRQWRSFAEDTKSIFHIDYIGRDADGKLDIAIRVVR